MNGTHKITKYSADKIALLGLFVLSLLIARVIVGTKSAIILSQPIKLNQTGLSVRLPTGNGWQCEEQWRLHDNVFTTTTEFRLGRRRAAAAQCRYLLAVAPAEPDTRLKKKASSLGGIVGKTGIIHADTLTVHWAQVKSQETMFDMLVGTTSLANNRRLDIEVQQTIGDSDLANKAFRLIAENIQFKDNKLLDAGGEIVEEIKNTGVDRFLHNQNQQAYFLIKDSKKQHIGFTMEVLVAIGGQPGFNVQAASLFYVRGRYPQEQVALFQSDNSFDEFTYKAETTGQLRRIGTQIDLTTDGTMTVKDLGPQHREKTYQPSPAAIPDLFFEQVLTQMLDSGTKKLIVDIINITQAGGQITPTLICRTKTEGSADQKAEYAFEVEFLDQRGFSERVYLNSQEQIYKRLARQRYMYTFERTTLANILNEFPERAEEILQKNKLLRQNQTQR